MLLGWDACGGDAMKVYRINTVNVTRVNSTSYLIEISGKFTRNDKPLIRYSCYVADWDGVLEWLNEGWKDA